MANPIAKVNRRVPTEREKKAEGLAKLADGAADSHPGLLMAMDIIDEMYDAGYLDIVHGMVKNRDKVETHFFELIKIAGLPVILKNVVTMMQFMSTLDPHKVQRTLNAVSTGMNQALDPEGEEHKGYFGMVKALRDPDVNRSLSMLLRFLQGMGEGLDKSHRDVNREMNRSKEAVMDEV